MHDVWVKLAFKPCHMSQVAKIRASEGDQLKFSIDDGSQVFRMRAETMYALEKYPLKRLVTVVLHCFKLRTTITMFLRSVYRQAWLDALTAAKQGLDGTCSQLASARSTTVASDAAYDLCQILSGQIRTILI